MRPAFPCGWEHTTPEGGKERTADRSRCRSFRTAVPFPVPGRRRLSSLLGVDAAGARAVKPWESLLAAGHSCNQSALGKPSIRARAPLLAGRVAWHGLAFPPSAVETSDPEGAAGQSACGFLACLTQLSPVRPVSYAHTRQHPRQHSSSLVARRITGSQTKDPIPLLRRRRVRRNSRIESGTREPLVEIAKPASGISSPSGPPACLSRSLCASRARN
ncbi:conserved hypothetical protein [Coccidioides posadasii str. Silveira]|uniref:Uncharacterized protein n=1 Tax=Coccidioides posadasii (strain RMSCC 757 / Silveira) TaxID=443226 RepID=E9DAW5_COCPS|nr:conserved hypothetical protein [Coccidioides posadasii str. Silveira]